MSVPPRVLFLCTGNSARSQMAEAILRHLTKGKADVQSAGSNPRPGIHPLAREAVKKIFGLEMTGQHAKSMDSFLHTSFDYVITVCDRAAESCPTFPGAPEVVRWSLPDPAEASGTDEEKRRVFENSARDLMQRIRLWLSSPGVAQRLSADAPGNDIGVPFSLTHRAIGEATGTAFLLATIVGSGIMGVRLSHGNDALALLANSLATGMGLVALIISFRRISGAHFNPLVTVSEVMAGRRPWRDVPAYLAAQTAGAFAGVAAAHAMFAAPIYTASTRARAGVGQWIGEVVATFGLLVVIATCSRTAQAVAPAVGAYITAAYWFTSSTSFANPAVTVARCVTNSFTGIRPSDVPAFVIAEILGGLGAVLFTRWLFPISRGACITSMKGTK